MGKFRRLVYNTYNPVKQGGGLGTDPGAHVPFPYSILTRLVCRIETPFESGEELALKAGDAILMGTVMDVTKAGIY